ncbi:MAG: glycosyltransferase family 4 protein [Chloroflexi bacterium]|nr:glycosyltransferase family 4 protein [Chloroflexota bacterium]
MRVLHLVKTSVGASWAYRQMRELVQLGVQVHVALPPGGPLVERYREAGVMTHLLQTDWPTRAPWRIAPLCAAFRQLVALVRPDVIHSHFVGTTLTMRLALGKSHPIARVFQVPGPLHLESAFFRTLDLATAGPADSWIGSCRWTCDRYRRSGVPEERVFLSYHGFDVERLASVPGGKIRRELGLAEDTRIVGMVAYMYAPKWYLGQRRGIKGHEDLIDALAICQRTRKDLLGVFVGGAWNNATRYESQVRAYGRARCGKRAVFLGTRTDVAELYPDFDVVVHPSHSENIGGAAESYLQAVPTIATEVGGFPDVVRPGETGWLVPPKDPVRLAEAILEALADPARARGMALRGQALAQELFDVRRTAAEVLDIYHTVSSQP